MISRTILPELQEIMKTFPALMLIGPRQIGKTTLAKELAATLNRPYHYFDLENESDLYLLKNNAQEHLRKLQNDVVMLDEVQIHPPLLSSLRSIIDEHRVSGRFILLGSADPSLVKGVSESLAGRIIYQEIHQISLKEAEENDIDQKQQWFRGGFPEALLLKSDNAWKLWTESFIQSYIFRDLNQLFGIQLNPQTIQKLWAMLAHLNGEMENFENIGRSLGITGTTVKKYLEYMEGAYLIRKLHPWHTNQGKRLVKSPKIYLRTSGILHFMRGISSYDELQKHPSLGGSWEGYVIEQIRTCLPKSYSLYYYRTSNGAEIDLIIVRGISPIAGIEIKYSNAPKLSRGFYESVEDLKLKDNYVITPNSKTFNLNDGTQIISLPEFLTLAEKKWH